MNHKDGVGGKEGTAFIEQHLGFKLYLIDTDITDSTISSCGILAFAL